jgi:hypothetical protein
MFMLISRHVIPMHRHLERSEGPTVNSIGPSLGSDDRVAFRRETPDESSHPQGVRHDR